MHKGPLEHGCLYSTLEHSRRALHILVNDSAARRRLLRHGRGGVGVLLGRLLGVLLGRLLGVGGGCEVGSRSLPSWWREIVWSRRGCSVSELGGGAVEGMGD